MPNRFGPRVTLGLGLLSLRQLGSINELIKCVYESLEIKRRPVVDRHFE